MLDIKDLKAILVLFRGKKYSYVRGRILVFKDEDTCYTERILRPVSELIAEIEDKYEYDRVEKTKRPKPTPSGTRAIREGDTK